MTKDRMYLTPSPRSNKRYRAYFIRGKDNEISYTDFGDPTRQNYTLHRDDARKQRFLARFNAMIERFKDNPQAATTLSTWLLWNKPTLKESLKDYKEHFNLVGVRPDT
jgi:hypothetical protein